MDMQKSRHGKKSFIRKSKVSIVPVKESPKKFSFSQIKDSFAPSGKSIDFLSLFLNPQNENAAGIQRSNEVKATGEKLVSDELNKLGISEEENLKNLLAKGKDISLKEEIKESEQRKRRVNFEDNSKSKRRIDDNSLITGNNNITVSIRGKEEKAYKIELFSILDSLLVSPITETNIKVSNIREDAKVYVITIGSEDISNYRIKVGIKIQLTLFYDSKKKEIIEVEYQFLSIDPPKFKLHDSMKVRIRISNRG